MAERESGYYWVCPDLKEGKWVVAEYLSEYNEWYLMGKDHIFTADEFDVINEEKIKR